MKHQIRIGRFFGIEVGLHVSWLIIAYLIVVSVSGHFHAENPGWTSATVYTTALITALLFFVTLLVHELSHSLVAKAQGIPVRAITLFALGGVSQMERESTRAWNEFWMALAGPLASFAIGALCLVVSRALGWRGESAPARPAMALLVWLGYINFGLGAFNLIPGYPLDGGRVLRAALWGITKNAERATRWAAGVGHWVAVAFIFYGVVQFFRGAGFNGLWIAFIGWFLNDAAYASLARVKLDHLLAGLKVSQIMSHVYPTADGAQDIESFVRDVFLPTGERYFVVEQAGRRTGIITPHEVRALPRDEWATTSVQAVMRPLRSVQSVTPDTPVERALTLMAGQDLSQVPVISDGEFLGVVSRGRILQLIQSRAELAG